MQYHLLKFCTEKKENIYLFLLYMYECMYVCMYYYVNSSMRCSPNYMCLGMQNNILTFKINLSQHCFDLYYRIHVMNKLDQIFFFYLS